MKTLFYYVLHEKCWQFQTQQCLPIMTNNFTINDYTITNQNMTTTIKTNMYNAPILPKWRRSLRWDITVYKPYTPQNMRDPCLNTVDIFVDNGL